jgi:hypothetical protein
VLRDKNSIQIDSTRDQVYGSVGSCAIGGRSVCGGGARSHSSSDRYARGSDSVGSSVGSVTVGIVAVGRIVADTVTTGSHQLINSNRS